jgi:drug/metabolite transporter (DMT)-like permease
MARRANRGITIRNRSTFIVHASLLLVVAMWGSNFVAMKYLLRSIDPVELLLLRLMLGSLIFGVVLLATSRSLPRFSRHEWGQLAIIGTLGISINISAVAFGTRLIPAGLASLIVTSNPVFTALLSRAVLGEALTRRKVLGILVAFCGFLIVLLWGGPNATFSLDNSLGVLITLAGPSAWALYTILSKPYVSRRPPTQFAGIVTIIGALPAMPFLLYDHRIFGDVTRFTPTDWLATLVSTGLALVLAYTLWYRGLRVLQPTQVAIYIYLVPVFGVLGAWLLLGEPVTIFLLLGGMTILGGVVLTNSARQGSIDENPSQVVVSGMRTATGSMAGIELSDQPVVE